MTKKKNSETICLHEGYDPKDGQGCRAVPIYATTSYMLGSSKRAENLLNHDDDGHFYARISNPTVDVLEKRLAALEGGIGALCTSSGQAATTAVLTTLLSQGDHIVASKALYGGSYNLMAYVLPRFGIETTFVDPLRPDEFKAALRPETKLIMGEIIANPGLEILDIAALADIAHGHDIPLLIDATFATPALCHVFDFGADIVVHSLTKWIGGHGRSLGGVVVDSGKYDWGKTDKFPTITEPCSSQGDINFFEKFGQDGFLRRVRVEILRIMGACLSPYDATNILTGLETLDLRMKKHCDNAWSIAQWLRDEMGEHVNWVRYPGLPDHPQADLVRKQLPNGAGGMVTFGIKGETGRPEKFLEALKLVSFLVNIGDARSLAVQPATQRSVKKGSVDPAGITPEWIRLSVGLEHVDDIKADLEQAFIASAL